MTKVAVLVPPRFTCHGFQISMAHRLASQSLCQKLVPSDANGSRATMFTTGGTLVGGGGVESLSAMVTTALLGKPIMYGGQTTGTAGSGRPPPPLPHQRICIGPSCTTTVSAPSTKASSTGVTVISAELAPAGMTT